MDNNEGMYEDEISLFDLWEKLRAGWKSIFGGACLGGLAAGVVVLVVAPKYEAASVLQIGLIAGKEIESATMTLERFRSQTFFLEAAKQGGFQVAADQVALGEGLVGDYVKVQILKGTSLLEVKTYGDTPESSKKLNDVLIRQLEQRHDLLGEPLKEKLKSDIALTRERLNVVEQELAVLSEVNYKDAKDVQFSPVSLLMSQKIQKQSEIFGLRRQLTDLELMQIAPATQKTQMLEAPFVVMKPVSPKRNLLLTLGLVGGVLLGVFIVLVKNSWVRALQSRARAS